MIWIVVLIVVQVVIAGVVIFVLKRLLDRELTRAALEKLQAAAIPGGTAAITVKFCPPLPAQTRARIEAIVNRRSSGTKVVFAEEPGLKGGLLIEAGGTLLDFSVSGRLQNFWSA